MEKLNFGCGLNSTPGWDNADIQEGVGNLCFDFNVFPYPISNDTYDEVYTRSVLEHLDKPKRVLEELHRVCKKGAIIEIIVPYYNNKSAYSDMDHKHFFNDTAFKNFVNGKTERKKPNLFEIYSLELVPTAVGKCLISKTLAKGLSLFFGGIISYIHVKLKVIK